MILTIFVSDSNSYEQIQAEDEEVSLVAFVDEAEHHELLDVIRESSASEMRVCCTNVTSSEIEEELQQKRACLVRGHMDGIKLPNINFGARRNIFQDCLYGEDIQLSVRMYKPVSVRFWLRLFNFTNEPRILKNYYSFHILKPKY